jgi:hypothetical protein
MLLFAVCLAPAPALAADRTTVGYASADVTPRLGSKPVFIAGYGQNRKATKIHDPLFARAIVLSDGQKRVALAAVDVVGLQYPTVQEIRKRLSGFDYVMVASTHNHEGPDTVGLWGPSPFKSGIDDEFMEYLISQTVRAIQDADAARQTVAASYGTADDERLVRDSRQPQVKDGVLRIVRFDSSQTGEPHCLLVNWTCHPEALASRNTEITADFPYYTIRDLEEKYGCPVIYFSGAVGGLMAPPRDIYKRTDGSPLEDGSFEYAERYGADVAELATKAVEAAEPFSLSPIAVSARPISVPLENPLYRVARMMGVLKREGRKWTGNPEELGEPITRDDPKQVPAGVTEVGYLQLGQLSLAAIPGELYPELVYGKVENPADAGADFPAAAVEPSIVALMPHKKFLFVGLANDELGYIVPKRQWDEKAPFAYGKKEAQYGEGNSCGPNIAPILMETLQRRVSEVRGK